MVAPVQKSISNISSSAPENKKTIKTRTDLNKSVIKIIDVRLSELSSEMTGTNKSDTKAIKYLSLTKVKAVLKKNVGLILTSDKDLIDKCGLTKMEVKILNKGLCSGKKLFSNKTHEALQDIYVLSADCQNKSGINKLEFFRDKLISVHPEMANLENFFIQKNSKFNFKVTKLLAA